MPVSGYVFLFGGVRSELLMMRSRPTSLGVGGLHFARSDAIADCGASLPFHFLTQVLRVLPLGHIRNVSGAVLGDSSA
jgi:hypothetical protein